MCNGLDQTKVTVESLLHECFAIAGRGHGSNLHVWMLIIQSEQGVLDHRQRIAVIGTIICKENIGMTVNDSCLDRSRSRINADMDRTSLFIEFCPRHRSFRMPRTECLIFFLILE